jgi:hypothetical protein
MHRKLLRPDAHLAGDLRLKMSPAIAHDGFQFEQFDEWGGSHAWHLRIALKEKKWGWRGAGIAKPRR